MDIAAIQAQQERLSREGEAPPAGSYVAHISNNLKVADTRTGRQLIFSVQVSDLITGRATTPAEGYDYVSVFQKFIGSEEKPWGKTVNNEEEASRILLLAGLDAYAVKAVLDRAASVEIPEKSTFILNNTVLLTDEAGNNVSFKNSTPVMLELKASKDGTKTFGSIKKLPAYISAA